MVLPSVSLTRFQHLPKHTVYLCAVNVFTCNTLCIKWLTHGVGIIVLDKIPAFDQAYSVLMCCKGVHMYYLVRKVVDTWCWQATGDGRGPGQWGSQKGFLDNEHAIWMGDLNYRLTIPDDKVRLHFGS